jgi:hypothetical protein
VKQLLERRINFSLDFLLRMAVLREQIVVMSGRKGTRTFCAVVGFVKTAARRQKKCRNNQHDGKNGNVFFLDLKIILEKTKAALQVFNCHLTANAELKAPTAVDLICFHGTTLFKGFLLVKRCLGSSNIRAAQQRRPTVAPTRFEKN